MRKAFTLLEIMVTIIILGVIATIALPQFNNLIQKGIYKRGEMDFAAIHSALQIYYAKHGRYLCPETDCASSFGCTVNDVNNLLGTDLKIDDHFSFLIVFFPGQNCGNAIAYMRMNNSNGRYYFVGYQQNSLHRGTYVSDPENNPECRGDVFYCAYLAGQTTSP